MFPFRMIGLYFCVVEETIDEEPILPNDGIARGEEIRDGIAFDEDKPSPDSNLGIDCDFESHSGVEVRQYENEHD